VPQPIDACAAFPYVDLSFTVNVREICASRWMVSELRSLIPSARDGREQRDHSPDSRVHPVLQVHQHCMKQIRAKKVSQALVALSLRYSGHVCLRPRIAVGTLIAKRPPHRTERARLRHSAPTLVFDEKALSLVLVHGQVPGTRAPGSVSGACKTRPRSPRPAAFAPSTPHLLLRACSLTSSLCLHVEIASVQL
jgi:hypothetical protein